MSFFEQKTANVVIDEENSVVIRALSYGEEQDIKQPTMRVSARLNKDGDTDGEATVDAVTLQRRTMYKCIVSWSGPGFDNRPVTPANIDALPTNVVDKIVVAYNKLTAPLSEEEKKE